MREVNLHANKIQGEWKFYCLWNDSEFLTEDKFQSPVYMLLLARQFTFKNCGIKKISCSESVSRKHKSQISVSSIVQYIFVDCSEKHIPQATMLEVHLQLISNTAYFNKYLRYALRYT